MTIHTKPQSSRPLNIAETFTKAWTAGDIEKAATFVADDVVFDGPLQKSTSKKPYVDGLTKLAADVKGVRLIAAFGDETQALLMYDLSTGPYGVLTCAKHLMVKDGKITRDQLAFDSFPIRGAGKH